MWGLKGTCSPGVPPTGKELSPGSSKSLCWLQRQRACRVPLQPRTLWPVGEGQDSPVWDRAGDPPPLQPTFPPPQRRLALS